MRSPVPFARYPVIGQAIGQATLAAVTPILTRMYSPSDFGTLQFATVIAACLVPIATWRAELVIPILKRARYVDTLLKRIRVIAALLVLLMLIGAVALSAAGEAALAEVVLLAAFIVGALSWNLIDSALLIRDGDLRRLGRRNAINGTVTAALQIVFGFFSLGPLGLALAIVIGRLASVVLTSRFRSRPRKDVGTDMETYRRSQAASGIATGILLGASLQMPAATIGILNGTAAGGQAATAQRAAGAPTSLVGMAVGQVVSAQASAFLQNGLPVYKYIARTLVKLSIISIGAGALVALVALNFSDLIFGPGWTGLGLIIAILTPMYVAQFAVTPITSVLPFLGRQGLLLRFELVRVCSVLAGMLVASGLGHGVGAVVVAWSAVGTALYIALGLLTLSASKGR